MSSIFAFAPLSFAPSFRLALYITHGTDKLRFRILLLPNISLRPLFDPHTNENGEHELTTFRSANASTSTSTSPPPPSTSALSSTSSFPFPFRTAPQNRDNSDTGDSDTNDEDSADRERNNLANEIVLANQEISISMDEEDNNDEVELVDRRKRRIRV